MPITPLFSAGEDKNEKSFFFINAKATFFPSICTPPIKIRRSIISHFRRGNKAVKREEEALLASCREVAQALDNGHTPSAKRKTYICVQKKKIVANPFPLSSSLLRCHPQKRRRRKTRSEEEGFFFSRRIAEVEEEDPLQTFINASFLLSSLSPFGTIVIYLTSNLPRGKEEEEGSSLPWRQKKNVPPPPLPLPLSGSS